MPAQRLGSDLVVPIDLCAPVAPFQFHPAQGIGQIETREERSICLGRRESIDVELPWL
jgi:hypothetical protein